MIFKAPTSWQSRVFAFLCLGLSSASLAGQVDDGQDGEFTMGAIGDSITTGFNASLPFSNESLSWSTGNNVLGLVDSHYRRIKKLYAGPVVRINEAKVGASAASLGGQMDQLTAALAGRELDYLTVMAGANDVCWWPKDHQANLDAFRQNIRSTVEKALTLNPDIKITLVPVPDMLRLYELGIAKKSCEYRWRKVPMCDALFLSKSDEERDAFRERLQSLNESLATLAQEFPGNIHYAEKVATARFETYDVSAIDCFHPSVTGHTKIAEDSWSGGWYDR